MKFSEINLDIVSQYLQLPINKENLLEVAEFEMYIDAAKKYIIEYTGLSIEEIDEIPFILPPTLLLISDMVENKTMDGSRYINGTFKALINIKKKVNL